MKPAVVTQLQTLLTRATAQVGPCSCADSYGPVAPYCSGHAAQQRAIQGYNKLLYANATLLLRIVSLTWDVFMRQARDSELRAALDGLEVDDGTGGAEGAEPCADVIRHIDLAGDDLHDIIDALDEITSDKGREYETAHAPRLRALRDRLAAQYAKDGTAP